MLAFVALLESVSVSFSGSLALFAELMTCCRLCSNKQCGGADSWACFPRASAPWWPIRRLLNPRMSSGSFCCSFTEAFPPRGVFFFRPCCCQFPSGYAQQQAPVAFGLFTAGYLRRLSLSPDLLHSFYLLGVQFGVFLMETESIQTFLVRVIAQHQTRHFSVILISLRLSVAAYCLSEGSLWSIHPFIHSSPSPFSFFSFFFFNLVTSLNLPSAIHSFIHHTVSVSGGTVYLSSPFPHHLIIHTVQGPEQQSCLLAEGSRRIWLSGKKVASLVRY